MLKFVIVLSVAVLALGSPEREYSVPRLDGKIVGGKDASIVDYPYQVSLLYKRRHYCGGSIISNQFVVTAVRCCGRKTSHYSIRAGSSYVNGGGVVVKVAKIHIHPNYNLDTNDNDVAVIQLKKQLSFGPSVNKINLPTENQHFPGGTRGVVTGWGVIKLGGPAPSQLQVVRVPIVDQKKCKLAYYPLPITDRMICAGLPQGGKDFCQGDTGGPLAVGGILVGIVSWGDGCGEPRIPGVYTSVPAVRSYIKQVSGI